MEFPSDLRYTQDHEWLRLSSDGKTATVGITDFAQHELGDIVYVELPDVDAEIAAGEEFGTVEAVKTVSELFMPISGTVVEINEDLDDSPESVNEDAYGAGWMVKISVSDSADVDALMDSGAYAEMVGT